MCIYINYHIVWSTKYRKKVLSDDIASSLKQWCFEIAKDNDFTIHLFEVGNKDHIHCFVSAKPTMTISHIVKLLKGITGYKLFKYYPILKRYYWRNRIWNPSYYVETIGCISEDTIRKYIENQN